MKHDLKKAAIKAKIAFNEFKTLKAELIKTSLPSIKDSRLTSKNSAKSKETKGKSLEINKNYENKKNRRKPYSLNDHHELTKVPIEMLSLATMNE